MDALATESGANFISQNHEPFNIFNNTTIVLSYILFTLVLMDFSALQIAAFFIIF